VNCAETIQDRPGQRAYEMSGDRPRQLAYEIKLMLLRVS